MRLKKNVAMLTPVKYVNIIKENELTLEKVVKEDTYKICIESVEQYVVDEHKKLIGVITSKDISDYCEGRKKDFVNRKPIVLHEGNRFNKDMAETIFDSSNIWTIPVVDENFVVRYFYKRAHHVTQKFVSRDYVDENILKYQIDLRIQEIIDMSEGKSIKITTDLMSEGIDLGAYTQCIIDENEIANLDKDKTVVLLVYKYDFNAVKCIRKLVQYNISFYVCNHTGKDNIADVAKYYETDCLAYETLREEAWYNANYFDLNDFQNLFQFLNITKNLKGAYVEIGTYRGDSARAALSYMEKANIIRQSYFIDTYEGFNYLCAKQSSDIAWYNSHTDTSLDFVSERLKEFKNYRLIKGNIITDSLPDEIDKIAICNIDVDMYEAVEAALNKVKDKIVQGGVIIAEDYGHSPYLWGAQTAISQFYKINQEIFHGIYMESGQFVLIRK